MYILTVLSWRSQSPFFYSHERIPVLQGFRFFRMNNSAVWACFFLLTLTWATTGTYPGFGFTLKLWLFPVSPPFQTDFLSSSLLLLCFLKMAQQWWKKLKWKYFTFVNSFLFHTFKAMAKLYLFPLCRRAGPTIFLAFSTASHHQI